MKKITLIILSLVLLMTAVCCSSNPVEPQEVSVKAVLNFSDVKLMKGDKIYFTAEWQFKGETKQHKETFTVEDTEMKSMEVPFKPKKVAGSMKVSVIRPFDSVTKDASEEGYEVAEGYVEVGEFGEAVSYDIEVEPVISFLTFTGKYITVTPNGWTGTKLEYSADGGDWTEITNGSSTPEASVVKFRGTSGIKGSGGAWWKIGGSGDVSVSGDIMTVLDWKNPSTTIPSDQCFDYMFANQSLLTDASRLRLPAMVLGSKCYYHMFYNCINLTKAPKLPATTLANDCYSGMFCSCGSLKVGTSGNDSQKIFTCPSTSDVTSPVSIMFGLTGGTFQGTPREGETYYWY